MTKMNNELTLEDLGRNEGNLLRALHSNGQCLGSRVGDRLISLGLAFPVNGTAEVLGITPKGREWARGLEGKR